ncbi:TauD/TfdA family dioxygenase [Streptomyces sp. NPDC001508]|uniref:TauD/TfdA family dioxygenase n=1 Tax=Streptomyces sp. NPDC001508 TaxID=3154656 RepID=UPI00331FA007
MPISSDTIDCAPYASALDRIKTGLPTIPRLAPAAFFDKAADLAAGLPSELRDVIAGFRANGNEAGFVHLRNLPLDADSLPPTPDTFPAPDDRPLLGMEPWVALFGMLLGKATGYRLNRGGGAFQDIFAVKEAHWTTANNFKVPLRYHTEMAYCADQQHYIVIGCARADHNNEARTTIASVRRALPLLDEADREILRTIPLHWHTDMAYRTQENPDPTTEILLLSNNDDTVRYDGVMIDTPEDPRVARALRAYTDAANATAVSVHLEPGDVLLVDNTRTSHSRTAYKPRFDGTDRWLQRVFVRDPQKLPHTIEQAEVLEFALRAPDKALVR